MEERLLLATLIGGVVNDVGLDYVTSVKEHIHIIMIIVDRYEPALRHGNGWPSGQPSAIMLHSTRSGQPGRESKEGHDLEMTSTINWFKSPDSNASSNLVISPKETVMTVRETDYAFHAVEHSWFCLSIEITQPLRTSPYHPEQYYRVADACIHWHEKYGVPLTVLDGVFSNGMRGITEHERSVQGIRDGKSDLGEKWNWTFFKNIIQAKMEPEEGDDMTAAIVQLDEDTSFKTYLWRPGKGLVPMTTATERANVANLYGISPSPIKISKATLDKLG